MVVDAAFEDRPGRNATFIPNSVYANDFERNYGVTTNSSNGALVGWKGSNPVYTVAVISNSTWDSSRNILQYTIVQTETQTTTNNFPSIVARRANQGKATTLKMKKCSFFIEQVEGWW